MSKQIPQELSQKLSEEMPHKYVEANGIRLAYDEFGQPSAPAIVLIMGLGSQLVAWPEEFCSGLAEKGYRVIRFDNRDAGLSQKMEGEKAPSLLKIKLRSLLRLSVKVPYVLLDMANDTRGLLDALNVEKAHVVGASMGGMIAQIFASHFPERTHSLVSIMSTSGCSSLPRADRSVIKSLISRPSPESGEKAFLEAAMTTMGLIGSPGYRPDEEALRDKILLSYRRSYYPSGFHRQLAAVASSGDRVSLLRKIAAPTLVIHGKADVLVPVEGGIDTARHIPDAKLELIEGMGHDFPTPLIPYFVNLIGSHIAGADKRAPSFLKISA